MLSAFLQNRKFLSDSGSLSFLASQKFDFNKWIYKGVPFLPAREVQKRMSEAVSRVGSVRGLTLPARKGGAEEDVGGGERYKLHAD